MGFLNAEAQRAQRKRREHQARLGRQWGLAPLGRWSAETAEDAEEHLRENRRGARRNERLVVHAAAGGGRATKPVLQRSADGFPERTQSYGWGEFGAIPHELLVVDGEWARAGGPVPGGWTVMRRVEDLRSPFLRPIIEA